MLVEQSLLFAAVLGGCLPLSVVGSLGTLLGHDLRFGRNLGSLTILLVRVGGFDGCGKIWRAFRIAYV